MRSIGCKLNYQNIDYFLLKLLKWSANKPGEEKGKENDKVSKRLHGTFLSIFQVFLLHSVWGSPYLRSVYSVQASQFCTRIGDRFQIDAVSPFSTVYMTNETIPFWKCRTFETIFKMTWFQCRFQSAPCKKLHLCKRSLSWHMCFVFNLKVPIYFAFFALLMYRVSNCAHIVGGST